MKKENLTKKIKQRIEFFTKRRYDFIILLLVLSFFNLSSNLDDVIERDKKKDELIEKLSTYTTYITDSGVIKQYEKEKFDVYKEKLNVANVLAKYLVQSAYDLTNGYKDTYFKTEDEMYKSAKTFQEFFSNYIVIVEENATEKTKASFEKGKSDWIQILRWFRVAVNKNNLPQSIDKKESDIVVKVWKTDENEFEIVFKIPVYATSLNNNNARDEGLSEATITAKGYYNLNEKNTINPYGMKFENLHLIHPKINHTLRGK